MKLPLLLALLLPTLLACGASASLIKAAPPRASPAAAAPAPAAPDNAPTAEAPLATRIDPVFAKIRDPHAPGCSVGVFRGGEIVFEKGYGAANLEWGGQNGPTTPFDLGSMSKQFTAAAILLLVQEGKVARTDDVRKYIPELPDHGEVVTIDELLHHTSGVRDFGLLFGLSGSDDDGRASVNDVLALLARQKRLNFAPGTSYSYSNSGYVLLGEVVRRVSGKSLAEFERGRIFEPLGMRDTLVRDDSSRVIPLRAVGYVKGKDGAFHARMGLSEVVGPGNVVSTIRDLAKWDANFYAPQVGGEALIDAMRVRGALRDGTTLAYAAGLEETIDPENGLPREEHSGAVPGFRSDMARYPTARTTVVVLCNAGQVNAGELVAGVVKTLLPRSAVGAPPAKDEAVAAPTSEDAKGRWTIDPAIEGLYMDEDGATVRHFAAKGGGLRVSSSTDGEREQALAQVGPDDFATPKGGRYTFFPAKGGAPPKIVRRGDDGAAVTLVRVDAPGKLDESVLWEYAGRYGSEEVLRDHEVAVVSGGLAMRTFGTFDEWTHLKPLAKDRFTVDGATLSFGRDARGRVSSLVVSSMRTRGVRLMRTVAAVPASDTHPTSPLELPRARFLHPVSPNTQGDPR